MEILYNVSKFGFFFSFLFSGLFGLFFIWNGHYSTFCKLTNKELFWNQTMGLALGTWSAFHFNLVLHF